MLNEIDFDRPVSALYGDLSPKQKRALAALLTQPTQRKAAEAAGIGERTLRTYLQDPTFQSAYKQAFIGLLDGAAKAAQQALSPAISVLHEIMDDTEQAGGVRVSAARSVLEYGIKLTELTDVQTRLDALERKYAELDEGSK